MKRKTIRLSGGTALFAALFFVALPAWALTCCQNIPPQCGGGQSCITCASYQTCGVVIPANVCYYHTASSMDDGKSYHDPQCNTPAVSCSPASQSALTGQAVGISGFGGNGSYSWSAPGGSPASGAGSFFSTAYGAAGTYTVTVSSAGTTANCSVSVSAAAGKVTVSSQNVANGSPVNASWDFPVNTPAGSNPTNPCAAPGAVCSGASNGTYNNVTPGNYSLAPGAAPSGYAFSGIVPSIAEGREDWIRALTTFMNDLWLSVAKAVGIVPSGTQPVTAGGTTSYTIQWTPVSAMSVVPSVLPLDSTTTSNTVTVSNTGGGGSSLAWNAGAPVYIGAAKNWLTITPTMSGTLGGGNSTGLTFAASTSAAHATATVTFYGTSTPGGPVPSQTVTVLWTKSASAPPLPNCPVFTANPAALVLPQTTTLTYKCVHVQTCALSGGQFGGGVSLSVTGTTLNGSKPAAPTTNTTYTLSCQGLSSGASYSLSIPVTVEVSNPSIIEINPH